MITLKQALQVTSYEDDTYCLHNPEKPASDVVLTREGIIKKYDIKHTMVSTIRPWFLCGDYVGTLLEISENKKNRK